MKKWVALVALLVVILGGLYVGSPYYAIHSLRQAAIEADIDKLEASVDFPAVRESLKAQLSAALMAKMQGNNEIRDNPFAGLGALLMPTIVDRLVDTFVTPDGIAALMRGQKPNDKRKLERNPDIEATSRYLGLDRFRVTLRNTKLNSKGPSFLFERRGFASWKLIKLEIPLNDIENQPSI